jgi:hypothetical protein
VVLGIDPRHVAGLVSFNGRRLWCWASTAAVSIVAGPVALVNFNGRCPGDEPCPW